MRVLFVSSEIYPLAKTGGLGDVSAALPKALSALGVEMQLLLPGYPKAIESAANKSVEIELADFMGAGPMRLISARTPDTSLPDLARRLPFAVSAFRRSVPGREWARLARQCATFRSVQPRCCATFARPAIGKLAGRPCPCQRLACRATSGDLGRNLRPKACDSVHDAQPRLSGSVSRPPLSPAGPYWRQPYPGRARVLWNISFLKAGISYSDRLTTVSPTYAREISLPNMDADLKGAATSRERSRRHPQRGRYRIWDPADTT